LAGFTRFNTIIYNSAVAYFLIHAVVDIVKYMNNGSALY